MKNFIKKMLSYSHHYLRYIRSKTMRANNNGFLRVLTYHDIPPQHEEHFSQQIKAAKKHYRFIDVETFCQMHQGNIPIDGGNILLTFDDGYKSNRHVAENILNREGIKALFFVLPDLLECHHVDDQRNFIAKNLFRHAMTNEQLPSHVHAMNWDDIQFLLSHGHSIGAHSCTHATLSELSSSQLIEYELFTSRDQLEKKLNIPINYFAYPFGDINSVNSHVLQIAKKHYQYVFSGVRGNNHARIHPLAIRRDHVDVTASLNYFYFILEGGLSPFYYFQQKQLDNMVRAYD